MSTDRSELLTASTGSLRPPRDVQKFLYSASCSFTGEYETSSLLLTHAWSGFGASRKSAAQPFGPNAFMFVFRTDPAEQNSIVIPSYRPQAEAVASYLSVLFGKRFSNHGSIEASGFFNLPDLSGLEAGVTTEWPQNRPIVRADFGFPLCLNEAFRLEPLFKGEVSDRPAANVFYRACKFYYQALHASEHDLDIAYLNLITAGEVLSSFPAFEDEELLDADTRSVLGRMASEMKDGERAAASVRKRLFAVKRRFILTLSCLTDDAFFERGEAQEGWERLKAVSFKKTLGAAYDVRSSFVHGGQSFGGWMTPIGGRLNEIQLGKPVVEDKAWGKALAATPTYLGLERIVRYAILRFGARELNLDLTLTPVGPAEAGESS